MLVKRHLLSSVVCFAALAFFAGSALSVNRCTDAKGKVTFQDAACDATTTSRGVDTTDAFSTRPKALPQASARTSTAAPPSPATARESSTNEYASARGSWRGPAQFQISVAGARDVAAQIVTPMVIEVRTTGEVAGVIPAAGCMISGLATTTIAPYIANLDVSLKSCKDVRFNVRYSGSLTAFAASKEAKLNLVALTVPVLSGKAQQTWVEAVLKR